MAGGSTRIPLVMNGLRQKVELFKDSIVLNSLNVDEVRVSFQTLMGEIFNLTTIVFLINPINSTIKNSDFFFSIFQVAAMGAAAIGSGAVVLDDNEQIKKKSIIELLEKRIIQVELNGDRIQVGPDENEAQFGFNSNEIQAEPNDDRNETQVGSNDDGIKVEPDGIQVGSDENEVQAEKAILSNEGIIEELPGSSSSMPKVQSHGNMPIQENGNHDDGHLSLSLNDVFLSNKRKKSQQEESSWRDTVRKSSKTNMAKMV